MNPLANATSNAPTRRSRVPSGWLWAALAVAIGPVGCSTIPSLSGRHAVGTSLLPTLHKARVGSFLVASNTPIDAEDPAPAELSRLENRIARTLGVEAAPDAPPIDVYILDDERAFRTFLTFHHPELPNRRAFFLADGDRAAIYTARGAHLEEDLRHEATHALLHRAEVSLPLWLDEGLAEYFEIDPSAIRTESLERFRRLSLAFDRGWRPDLGRLEGSGDVAMLSPNDYREAWAWTLLLLHGPDRPALLAYLDAVRDDPASEPLSLALDGDLDRLHRAFLSQVSVERPRAASTPRDRLTRLQSPPAPNPPVVEVRPSPIVPRRPVNPPSRLADGPFRRVREGFGVLFGRITRGPRSASD